MKRTSFRPIFLFMLLGLVCAAVGCITGASTMVLPNGPVTGGPDWKPLYQGVEFAQIKSNDPLQAVYAVRIDLQQPGISFLATPSNGDTPGETDGMKTSTFLKKYNCTLAVNASPFDPVRNEEGLPTDIIGLHISHGEPVSASQNEYGALLIGPGNQARVSAPPFDTAGVTEAVGGFNMLLEKGQNVGQEDTRHPRTAAGVSKEGRYLYLAVMDGRQPLYSVGATTKEMADWMAWLGSDSALNLDGGGSTALVVRRHNGEFKVLNTPIHLGQPGTERVNGNHFGVFAPELKRLPKIVR